MSSDSRYCTYCHCHKPWIWSQQRLKDGSKIYTNDRGERWAGRRCPDCEKTRVQETIKLSSSEKDYVIRQLKSRGYDMIKATPPMVVRKNGQDQSVGICKAVVQGENIVLESSPPADRDVVVLIFQNLRILSQEELNRLEFYSYTDMVDAQLDATTQTLNYDNAQ